MKTTSTIQSEPDDDGVVVTTSIQCSASPVSDVPDLHKLCMF